MSDVFWLAGLRQQVAEASARTVTTFAKLQDSRRDIDARLQRTLTRLGRVEDARERATDAQVHERVLAAFRQRQFGKLSVREQRYAAKQFPDVPASAMQDLLTAHPSNWRTFAAECFRRWDALGQVTDRGAYTRLLCLAPPSVTFVHQSARPQDLVSPDGPAVLSRSVAATSLVEARDVLRQRGFEPTWSFTAQTLAAWMYARSELPHAFAHGWHGVTNDRMLEAMLLPPLAGSVTSWFSTEPRPARVRRSRDAYVTFVAALIRAAYAQGVESSHWNVFTENLLRSTFGDPRIPPESKGWARLKQRDEPAYQRFLEQLITEDLRVFFAHAMTDPRREKFWLRYLKSVRRTVCILDRTTHTRLKSQLAGADERLAAAISRARKFTTKTTGAQAFCLYFDSVVVVEFSEQGNAAYVYPRASFEKNFEQEIYKDRCANSAELKSRSLARDRILHMGDAWEQGAFAKLAAMGLHPDLR